MQEREIKAIYQINFFNKVYTNYYFIMHHVYLNLS